MVDINRINELSKKSKTVGLTEEEKIEQTALRNAYRQAFINSLKSNLNNIEFADENKTNKK